MRYFNGFSLKNEEIFFQDYIVDSDYCVAGFSYGAIKAFEYVYNSSNRVDRLILLSPAFFQNEKKSFIRTQLRYYKSNPDEYISQFIKNVVYPSDMADFLQNSLESATLVPNNTRLKPSSPNFARNLVLEEYISRGSYSELESLLTYIWDREKIQKLIDRGVTIEVFIGGEDKIVNSQKSFEFFCELTTTYLIKDVGHLFLF